MDRIHLPLWRSRLLEDEAEAGSGPVHNRARVYGFYEAFQKVLMDAKFSHRAGAQPTDTDCDSPRQLGHDRTW